MIEADEWQKLKGLQAEVACPKRFACLDGPIADLCEGKYHSDLEIMECLEKSDPVCKFARPFGCTLVCTCPMRKLIAKNFDRWSAESTAVLRQAPG